MSDKRKIILMTKLAIYDKKLGDSDRKLAKYFRHDYIYRKNMWTRFFVGIATVIIIGLYWAYKIFIDGTDIFGIDYEAAIFKSVVFALVVIVFYSIIGTIIATIEYQQAKLRLQRYFKVLNHLDKLRSQDMENDKYDLINEVRRELNKNAKNGAKDFEGASSDGAGFTD